MSGNVREYSPFGGVLIDDRNERPLMVGLTTIVMVWSFAFALTVASGHIGVNSASWLGAPLVVTATTGK